MQFQPKRKKRSILNVNKYSLENTDYPHRLQLYKSPPPNGDEISLEEFEKFAVERLKLLREVENITIRFKRESDEYNQKFREAMKNFLPFYTGSSNVENQISDRRKDHLSHFILRLAFARSEDLRRWFLTQEMELFRYRFAQEESKEKTKFFNKNDLNFDSLDEKSGELVDNLRDFHGGNMDQTTFYKVPFTDVLDLVRVRKVCLRKGFAYVHQQELVSIIIGMYRTHLSQALTKLSRKLPYLEEDTRLLPILKHLSSTYIGDSYTTKKDSNTDKLSLNEMDEASKISYPICMRSLHEGLRKDHHLKHYGRLQYGLFIKGAGLSLEEALMFWKSEFTKMMDVDKFEKSYAYNFRHSYGKEGKRADYTPYSCLKIITTNQPGSGDYHGCPFKHSDKDALKRRLQSYKIPAESINEILLLVREQHFQVACARYFEVTHKQADGTASVNHPNQYFDESRKILNGGKNNSDSNRIKIESVKTDVKNTPNKSKKIEEDIAFDDDIDMSEAMDF